MLIDIIKTTDEDKAKGFLIDQLKYLLQTSISPHLGPSSPTITTTLTQILNPETLKSLFQLTFKLESYILDILDSVLATLALYLSILIWDKQLNGILGIWKEEERVKVFEEYINPLLLGANAAGSQKNEGEETKKEGGIEVPPEAKAAHSQELNKLCIFRELIDRIGVVFEGCKTIREEI